MSKKKILVNICEPLNRGLKKRLDAACLKRDAYLDLILGHEALKLDEEVRSPNSDEARNHIGEQFGLLKRQQVNLLLSGETVKSISDVCKRKNTPRDAFINRVILLLLARPSFIKKVFYEIDWDSAWDRRFEGSNSYTDERSVLFTPNRLDAIADIVQGDPFWYLRECIESARKEDDSIPLLHQTLIGKDMLGKNVPSALGFNCFIDDSEIEGHAAQAARAAEVDRMLDELLGEKETRE